MSSREIFIVEDDVTIRAILSAALTSASYKVISFFDGEALLAAVRKRRPHWVLLDVCLPGKSGLEILRDLQAVDAVRVIMISGHEPSMLPSRHSGMARSTSSRSRSSPAKCWPALKTCWNSRRARLWRRGSIRFPARCTISG
ncbi:MAG: response regulator [Xanthobacteraceae bacterium]|nr:response regulator [Xanthobacteraceae bacterium]